MWEEPEFWSQAESGNRSTVIHFLNKQLSSSSRLPNAVRDDGDRSLRRGPNVQPMTEASAMLEAH